MAREASTDPGRAAPAAGERHLARRLAAGDREAAELLAAASYRKIYAALFRLTGGDEELAADLTQEAYRRAWAALASFRGEARFSTWLYRIAYNLFLNHLRRPRRLEPLDEEVARGLADEGPSPLEGAAGRVRAARLRRAVLELPEELRFAITARYWGELPVREIARLEGLSAVGVRKRLLRAYRRLAEDLDE